MKPTTPKKRVKKRKEGPSREELLKMALEKAGSLSELGRIARTRSRSQPGRWMDGVEMGPIPTVLIADFLAANSSTRYQYIRILAGL